MKKAKHLEALAEQLRAAHGARLVSVVAYGAPPEDAHPESDRVLVVLERIEPEDLRAAHDAVAAWIDAGNAPPVYFTRSEIAGASDVFPMEFLDMQTDRRVLAGSDALEGINVSTRNLRHQVEYELRGKLVRLRRFYIPASADAARLTNLLVESLATFSRLFRHALALAGAPAGARTERAIIRAAIAHFGLDAEPFDRILEVGKTAMPEALAHKTFGHYVAEIERVVDAVDKIAE